MHLLLLFQLAADRRSRQGDERASHFLTPEGLKPTDMSGRTVGQLSVTPPDTLSALLGCVSTVGVSQTRAREEIMNGRDRGGEE